MAEVGAFWGAGKKVIVYLADPEITEQKLPPELKGNLWTDDAQQLLKAVKEAIDKAPLLEKAESYPETLQKLYGYWKKKLPNRPHEENKQDFKLFSFCGLTDEKELDHQNATDPIEQVYFLWADASCGSTVAANVQKDNDERYIRIQFLNEQGGESSNVAIRPGGRILLSPKDPKGFQTLEFKARVPFDQINQNEGDEYKVQLGIRVVDALTTHWKYSTRGDYTPEYIDSSDWTTIKIDLAFGNLASEWALFLNDGNFLYHNPTPDFSAILVIIFEVGSYNSKCPGSGKGVVDIKDIVLT